MGGKTRLPVFCSNSQWRCPKGIFFLFYTIMITMAIVPRYRSVVDRVLSMRLVYVRRQMNRQVDFDFLNRQLVWQGFTEFVLFMMPFISLQALKNRVMGLLPRSKSAEDALPAHICAICTSATIHTPYQTDCGHTFWFVLPI